MKKPYITFLVILIAIILIPFLLCVICKSTSNTGSFLGFHKAQFNWVCKFINCADDDVTPICRVRRSSDYEVSIPELKLDHYDIESLLAQNRAKIIEPPTARDSKWSDIGMNIYDYQSNKPFVDEQIEYYFFMAGDYRSLGTLKLTHWDGTLNKRKFLVGITKVNGQYDILENNYCTSFTEVLLPAIHFINASYWTVSGITFKGDLSKSYVTGFDLRQCSNYNIINNCLVENSFNQCIRIINSSRNIVQNSMFRISVTDSIKLCNASDVAIGVQIDAYNSNYPYFDNHFKCNTGQVSESRGNVVCNNYFYDLVDGIAIPYRPGEDVTLEHPETIIDNNIFYLDKMIRQDFQIDKNGAEYAIAENGMDIKSGSLKGGKESLIISNNILSGYRPPHMDMTLRCDANHSPGAIVVHQNSQNIIFENNYVDDSTIGFQFNASPAANDFGIMKNITVRNNVFSNIKTNPFQKLHKSNQLIYGHPIIISNNIDTIRIQDNLIFDSTKPILKRKDCNNQVIIVNGNKFYNIDSLETGPFEYMKFELSNMDRSCISHSGNIVDTGNCTLTIDQVGKYKLGCSEKSFCYTCL